jgi:hypothetical protein
VGVSSWKTTQLQVIMNALDADSGDPEGPPEHEPRVPQPGTLSAQFSSHVLSRGLEAVMGDPEVA